MDEIILPLKTPPIKISSIKESAKPLYLDKYHKRFCKNKNVEELYKSNIPYIETDITVNIPILFIKQLNNSTSGYNFI
jgi:hypothetical protein